MISPITSCSRPWTGPADELFRLNLGKHTNQVPSTAALRAKRREVATILTILRARDLDLEAQGQKRKES